MKAHFVVSAVGENITGIVSAISKEIYECGCDFQNSTMTFLERHFCLMVLVTADDEAIRDDLEARLERLRQDKSLCVSLFSLGRVPAALTKGPVPNYEIRVKGQNRTGIVYRTSQLLAALKINIVEMETNVEEMPQEEGLPVFFMRAAVVVPADMDVGRLRKSINALAEDFDDTVLFNPLREDAKR
jgi:glycine cleavage system transcriptional repressor